MVSGLLYLGGAFTGETVPADPQSNPKGFFENIKLREGLTKKMLGGAGFDPLGVKELPPIDYQWPDIRQSVLDVLEGEGYDGRQPWLYKDAKLCLTWPAWRKAFPDAHWVFVRRRTDWIVQSCLATHFMVQHSNDPKFWAEFVKDYAERMEALARTGVTFSEIDSQKIIDGDFGELKHLHDQLGLNFNEATVLSFIDKKAWRTRKGTRPAFFGTYLNRDHDEIKENVRANCKAGGWMPLAKHPIHLNELVLVGGGPSLKEQRNLRKIKKLQKRGAYVLTFNGTHDYLLSKRIKPWGMAMMDARPDNVRFVKKARPDITYFIASQCDPAVFKELAGKRVILWHKYGNYGEDEILRSLGLNHAIMMGGNTVGITGLNLGMWLGFRQFHLFGFDSCYAENDHHAYQQALNDGEQTQSVICGDKEFKCAVWMARQAQDFQEFCRYFGHQVAITVHGEGLIPEMVKEIAKREAEAA